MVRNAGKFGKPKRGGKKVFSQNLRPLDDEKSGMWDEAPKGSSDDDDDDDDEEEDSESQEDGSGEEDEELNRRLGNSSIGSSSKTPSQIAETRAERRAAKKKGDKSKASKEEDLSDEEDQEKDDLTNPNHIAKKAVKVSEISKVATGPMNRKEREAAEKKAAQERYWKLHQEGKTDQAKVDLARLAKIRQEREQAAAFRKAEAEAKAKEAAEKAALSGRKKK